MSELRQNSSQTHFTKLIELAGWQGGYTTGGNLSVYARNTRSKIDRMKQLLNYSINYVFTTKSAYARKLPVPSPISTDTYLSDYIDLNGPVTKKNMLRLRDYLSDDDYAKIREARDRLAKDLDDVFDIVDLLEAAKIRVTLDLLVNLDKRIEVDLA